MFKRILVILAIMVLLVGCSSEGRKYQYYSEYVITEDDNGETIVIPNQVPQHN